jgi:hypothetical protein
MRSSRTLAAAARAMLVHCLRILVPDALTLTQRASIHSPAVVACWVDTNKTNMAEAGNGVV